MASEKRRDFYKSAILKSAKYMDSLPEVVNEDVIITRYDLCVDSWRLFQEAHLEVLEVTGNELMDFQVTEFDAVEAVALEVIPRFKTYLRRYAQKDDEFESAHSNNGDDVTNHTNGGLRIPYFKIPLFSGDYDAWPAFKDLFRSMIHTNAKMSTVQKLGYLKINLSGEALKMIKNLEITDANYDTAWQLLADRYDNERLLVHRWLSLIFSIPVSKGNASDIKAILDGTQEAFQGLKNLNRPVEYYDDFLVYLSEAKLDSASKQKWEDEIANAQNVTPTWQQMGNFLKTRFRALETVVVRPAPLNPTANTNSCKPSSSSKPSTTESTSKPDDLCLYCKKKHRLTSCFLFQKKPFNERQAFVNENRLCLNCLSHGHKHASCASTFSCRICQQRHHTLLHVVNHSSNVTSIDALSANVQQGDHHYTTLLATALIHAYTSTGIKVQLRALIDQGSQVSFIHAHAVNRLGLRAIYGGPTVKAVGTSGFITTKGVTELTFLSNVFPTETLQVMVTVLDKITGQLPSELFEINLPKGWGKLPLADNKFYQPGNIDVLLGADVVCDILRDGLRRMPNHALIAQNSSLGWLLSGKVKLSNPIPVVTTGVILEEEERFDKLTKQIQAFWEIENAAPHTLLDPDDQICEEHFKATHYRDETGRFVVRLPFKPAFGDHIRLGNSRSVAIYTWLATEKRMIKSPHIRATYDEIMDKLIQNKYMQPIPHSELDVSPEKSCYLPHHIVTKGGKNRIVFNASKKTSTGFSLNDALLVGPPLQNDLFDIIIRVRQFRIAFSTDVVKMFRQFGINQMDVDYQRFVYRRSTAENIQHYRLVTVLDGTACASYLANKIIRTLAHDERHTYPLACEVASRDVYVDDLLSGCHDLYSAIDIRDQLTSLFQSAGMELSKWSSNEPAMLQSLPDNLLDSTIELGGVDVIKTLGIFWSPQSDEFHYRIRLDDVPTKVTKRQLLSEASKLFDPVGWVAPCIVIPKMLFQSLWSITLQWDDALPPSILNEWLKFREQLPQLEKLKIRRWTGNTAHNKLIELHGFSDASMKAYAAVVYTKVIDVEGNLTITLLTAKTKVAPIKTISLPRLELCGALLLAHLLERTMTQLHIPLTSVQAYVDSQIVLAWLQSRPSRWKTFVANRTAEILRILPANHWHYVPSDHNPADCASRGLEPSLIASHSLWWNGPTFLHTTHNNWAPRDQPFAPMLGVDMEERRNVLVGANISVQPAWDIRTRYSSLGKLLRVTVYCLRFVNNCRKDETKVKGCITPIELEEALQYWIKVTQAIYFHDEINSLTTGVVVHKTSHVIKLNPMLDGYGVLRVGGRLTNSDLPFERQHPIILPKTDHFTNLILDFYHKKTLHGNVQLMLNCIRDKYWILNARSAVRNWIHHCNRCYRFTTRVAQQLMADLPTQRVTPSRTFQHTAIDYAGPVKVSMRKGRGKQVVLKGYVCICVCMATRAIHLELVGELTADAFISAFKRFVSRRGRVTDVYSDNGSNFVAAHEIMSEDHRQAILDKEIEFASLLANDGVTWHFSPPSAPHFNGLAEAGVRSMKYHLRRIVGATILTYEELYTVLCQIEGVLNSRPLSAITDDFSDLTVLTPGHFLMGSAPISVPGPMLLNTNQNRLTRWQLMEQMQQNFWQIWASDYLTSLQQRPKWQQAVQNLAKGQLVIIRQDNLPPTKWLLGRIEDIHPGDDGLVRVATVRTQSSILKRPIVKLCPLPSPAFPDEENNHV